jgi:hypothetical protein
MSKSIYPVYLKAIASILDGRGPRFGLIFSLTLTIKRPFSGCFRLIFGFKTDLSDQTPSPTCQSRCIFLVWRPLNYALMGAWWEESGFGLMLPHTSHSRKRAFFHIFFSGYFGSFSAIELLYRTRFRAPHVKHDVSNSFEGACIGLWR